MTLPFTSASKQQTGNTAGKSVMARVSDRKKKQLDKIKTGAMLEGYKNPPKGK